MTQVVNNTDILTYILTDYGLNRVAQALADENVKIYLTKIKFGDANFEYYEPEQSATELKHPIENASFGILKKELLEDNLTISLRTFIPESLSGCEIREVGIYETVEGVDYLFAIGTQQPLIKPLESLRYFISVDYYAFLKSQNLSEIYDQIVLLPDDQLVTKEDLENLMSTILFTESNLIEQINGNSRVIGLNRPEQLKVKIDRSMETFGFTAASNIYSTLMSHVKSDSVYAYWLFDYSQRLASQTGVTDIGIHGRNLSTNQSLNLYNKSYQGILPALTFKNSDYYYLLQGKSSATYNPDVFHIVGDPLISPEGIASSFEDTSYITTIELSSAITNSTAIQFEFSINTANTTQSILFTSINYSLEAYYDSTDKKLKVRLGDGEKWTLTLATDIVIMTNYTARILFNGREASLSFFENGEFKTKDIKLITSAIVSSFGLLTLGAPKGEFSHLLGTMDLKGMTITINGTQIFSGSLYTSQDSMTLTNEEQTADSPFVMMFALSPTEDKTDRTLLARSNYATNSHIFEVNEKANGTFQVKLFTDANNYLVFYTAENKVPTNAHSIVIGYNPDYRQLTAFIGGHKVYIHTTEVGTYTRMNDAPFTLRAFVYVDFHEVYSNNLTNPTELYNADGTRYTGSDWTIADNQILYKSNPIEYSGTSINTRILYVWTYTDGVSTEKICTDTLNIEADTVLYNDDYTVYTGTSFQVVQKDSSYIIQYNGNDTEYTSNVPSKVLYKYYYLGNTETIWANSSTEPTILYTAKNIRYTGTDWTISNNKVYYKEYQAEYDSLYDYTVPTLPVTSYIINSEGLVTNNVNSTISVISVIKNFINEEGLRSLSLNLEAAIGNNPCTTVY